MQMSTQHGFAFLCTPKCASTAVEKAIEKECNINFSGPPSYKHINAQKFSDVILSFHNDVLPSIDIESFCLIRDPLERIKSFYRFRARKELKNPAHPNHKNYTGDIGYDKFIKAYISKGERPSYARLATQYDFMKLNTEVIGVDYVFPMNQMEVTSSFLSNKIGKKIKIPKMNVSPKIDVSLSSSLEEQLRHHLKNDIALYELIKRNGKFDKKIHLDELATVLQF